MRQHGIKAKRKQSYKATTQSNHPYAIAPNLLDQKFDTMTGPNQVWVTDITYIATWYSDLHALFTAIYI